MKWMNALIPLSLLMPALVWGGVIFGNVMVQNNGIEKPAGDTLRVVLLPDDGSLAADVLSNPEAKGAVLDMADTTDAYASFNLFLDGTGSYKLYLYGKAKGSLLAAPLAVQIYDEPVEYILILSSAKDAAGGHKFDLRRK